MTELMRLQIPRGWMVLDNKFYDVEPKTQEDGHFITNFDEGFMEDVLWIQECLATQQGYEVPKTNHFHIDLGWYPDANISGNYYAKLSWMATDELIDIESFKSRDRFLIREKIEFWMLDIKSFDSQIRKKVSK